MEDQKPGITRLVAETGAWVCVGLAGGVAAAQLIGVLAPIYWLADLTVHFQVQYLVVTVLSCIGLLLLRRVPWALVVGLLMLLVTARMASFILPAASDRSGPTLRVLLANVWTPNPNHGLLQALLESERPDIAALLEVDERWLVTLQSSAEYQVIAAPRDDNFGIALVSTMPVLDMALLELADSGLPAARMEVATSTGPLQVLAVHPPPPRHRDWWKLRNRQLEEIANLVRSHSGTWLVLGDLNTTPWAPSFRRLVRASGLVNSALGHGLDPTWPARWPWPLRIQIDHCLHSPALTTINRRVGPAIGSDHLPLIVDIGLGR